MQNIEEHERLKNVTEQQLFAEIGHALLRGTLGSTQLTPEEEAEAGRSWFESVLPSIRSRICGNKQIDDLLLSPAAQSRNTAIIAAIECSISGLFNGVPVITVAHAIVCYGIIKICDDR